MLVAKNFSDIVTFARASSGTFVGSDGLVKVAGNNQARLDFNPVTLAARGLLVEESRTNLLVRSHEFEQGPWASGLTNCSVRTNADVAPDGTVSADYVVASAAGATSIDYRSNNAVTVGVTYTASMYVKAATALVRVGLSVDIAWAQGGTSFDLVGNGTVVAGPGSITHVGNGWYRLTTVATLVQQRADVGLSFTATSNQSGFFIWGAQLEAGAFATSYIPSSVTFTGRTSTGTFIGSNGLIQTAASGVARQQYNPLNLSAAPFLLLEEQRTNRFIQSAGITGSWNDYSQAATYMVANSITAPDGSGQGILCTSQTGSVVSFGAGPLTYSFFVKQGTSATVSLTWAGYGGQPDWLFTFSSQTLTVNNGWQNPLVQSYGNGWFRISATIPATQRDQYYWLLVAASVGQTFYVWGAQVEAGSYPTSYIPTTTSQVTRAADTSTSAQTTRSADEASVNTLSPWFNASAGTIYVEASIPVSASTRGPVRFDDGTANNRLMIRDGGATRIDGRVISGGTSVANLESAATAFTANTTFKAALAYAANDFALSFNGGAALTDTAGALPSAISRLLIGDANASNTDKGALIRRITYYPRRMSNAELQTLTA